MLLVSTKREDPIQTGFDNLRWFPGGSDDKVSAYNAGDLGSIPGSARSPGEGNGHSSTLAWKIPGQRNLVGYSPWGRKKLDTTEWSHFTSLHFTSF